MRTLAIGVIVASSLALAATAGPMGEPPCHDVPPETRAFYQQNATDKMPNARLTHGKWVASGRPYHGQGIYFFSFAVEGTDRIATWAQNGRDPTRSMQIAVGPSYADELSILGTAGNAPIGDVSWPGAQKSRDCVRKAMKKR